MNTSSIDDYLYYEFDVSSPTELSDRNKHIAYERLKHKIIQKDLSPDKYTKEIVELSEYLGI